MTSPFSLSGKSIAVLMGGPGAEREVSLRSGAAVTAALASLGAQVTPVNVVGRTVALPGAVDLAFNMIHGTFGEDGELQALLDGLGVPFTGEGAAGSALAFDKIESKKCFVAAGVPTPGWEILSPGMTPTLTLPFVAKPPREGSSVGVHIVKDAADISAALDDCYARDGEALVEAFIEGAELTVGIVGNQPLPVVEIVPRVDFYTYENKYTKGASEYFCPARIDADATARVQQAALAAYQSLNLEVYARVDVLLDASGAPYVLEVNTIPGMTETSLLPKAAAAVGISFAQLCERIAELSLAKRQPIH